MNYLNVKKMSLTFLLKTIVPILLLIIYLICNIDRVIEGISKGICDLF